VVSLPALPPTTHEAWLTVRAVLAKDEPWAAAGHEVAWGQFPVSAAADESPRPSGVSSVSSEQELQLGSATFSLDGQLTRLGGLEVSSPVLDVWRAPIDNDRAFARDPQEVLWRQVGLDRMQHRVDEVTADGPQFVVRSRVAPAATTLGLVVTYRWSAREDGLLLQVDVVPDGDWPCLLPRLGVRMSLPSHLDRVEWFGQGPEEAYPDSALAARVGRYRRSIDDWQTPYVFPQENGHRAGVRRATITDSAGAGLLVEGQPTIGLTVRRWTTEDLDAASHTSALQPTDRVWLNLDAAHNGLGTSSCGPGVLPAYQLGADSASFAVVLRPLPSRSGGM
jgi:beta-galactosidase